MEVKPLTIEYINEDFLETLSSLKPTGLTVEEARIHFETNISSSIFVALIDNKVVGTAAIVFEKKFIHRGGIIAHIEDVAVRKGYQGQGIGLAILSHLIEVAQQHGCYKVILDCKPELENFYGKLGFKKTAEVNLRLDFVPHN